MTMPALRTALRRRRFVRRTLVPPRVTAAGSYAAERLAAGARTTRTGTPLVLALTLAAAMVPVAGAASVAARRESAPAAVTRSAEAGGTLAARTAAVRPIAPVRRTGLAARTQAARTELVPVRGSAIARAVPRAASRSALRRPPVTRTRVITEVTHTERGRASWYGPGFHGRRTANGEVFDTGEMTAAHRWLRFGTRLRVCTQTRCVRVRVNDRGPFIAGRVVDLSRAAAKALGIEGRGVAKVTLTVERTRTITEPVPVAIAAPAAPRRRAAAGPLVGERSAPAQARAAVVNAQRAANLAGAQARPLQTPAAALVVLAPLVLLVALPVQRRRRPMFA